MTSVVDLDVISVVALARGWVEVGLILTSVAILIEAFLGKQRGLGNFSRAKTKENWLVGMRVGLK